MFWPQHRPHSAVEPQTWGGGGGGFWFSCPDGQGNFTFACQDLSRPFCRALIIKNVPAIPGIYPGWSESSLGAQVILLVLSCGGQYTSHVTRKPVFRVCDQLRLKPACSATEISLGLEISTIASRGIILSRQQTTKALIKLCGCACWSSVRN